MRVMDEAQTLRLAKEAIRQGDKAAGQRLLLQVIQADPRNGTAWLWLSAIADDPAEERACLERVIEISPDSDVARRHLSKLQRQDQRRSSASNIAKVTVVALIDGVLVGLLGFCSLGLVMALGGMSFVSILCVTLLVTLAVVGYHLIQAQSEL